MDLDLAAAIFNLAFSESFAIFLSNNVS
jgi:hypothetical protein